MSPNKRKITEERLHFCEKEDSYKHRRSSLRVNLSYSANLSDSGNGSLRRTEVESDTTMSNIAKPSRRSSRNSTRFEASQLNGTTKSGLSNKNASTGNGICLKTVSVVLEDINRKEKSLNTTCEELKDAILNKTKEIFDKNNELSIKTATILGKHLLDVKTDKSSIVCKRNPSKTQPVVVSNVTINNYFGCVTAKDQVPVLPKVAPTNKESFGNNEKGQSVTSIGSIPKYKSINRHMELSEDNCKIKKKRLFVQEKDLNIKDVAEDDVSKKNEISNLTLAPKEGQSPILSGSHKGHNSLKCSLQNPRQLYIKSNVKSLKPISPQSQANKPLSQCSVSSIAGDESISGVYPIGCSTMVEEEILSNQDEMCTATVDNDPPGHQITCTKKNIVSMEMTDMRGGFIVEKEGMATENENRVEKSIVNASQIIPHEENAPLNSNKCSCLTERFTVRPDTSLNGSVLENVEQSEQTTLPNNTQAAKTEESGSEESTETMQLSLHVNTSLDMPNKGNGIHNDSREVARKTTDGSYLSYKKRQESITQLIQTENREESINTVCTSLQMNTSLDKLSRSSLQYNARRNKSMYLKNASTDICKSIISSGNKSDGCAEENMSLTERLKGISMLNSTHCNSECNAENIANNHINTKKHKLGKTVISKNKQNINDTTDGKSYIEATPYPPSRSIMLRSQLKQNTQLQNSENSKNTISNTIGSILINNKVNSMGLRSTSHVESNTTSNIPKETVHNTIILDESPIHQLPPTRPSNVIIIDDSGDKEDPRLQQNESRNSPNTSSAPKKTRKKLLPLRENSQLLSFTPMQEEPMSPKPPVYVKKRNRLMKKMGRNKPILKNNTNARKLSKSRSDAQSPLEDDTGMFREKKKEKKPRKIISKKIVIKRIVTDDILQILEERQRVNEMRTNNFVPGRVSLNDFQDKRVPNARLLKNSTQKIVIVTTGLSKEDKSLVKSVVKSLGMARIETSVSRRTTHIVTTGVRTISLLHGIIRGCWLVSLEWVLKSLESNGWLNPEEYEMTHFSKAVMENRKDRQLFGASYVPELFATCGFIHVQNGTSPPCSALKDLVKAAGGRITENPQTARIIIGTEGLKETWIIDCITTGELQAVNEYRRN